MIDREPNSTVDDQRSLGTRGAIMTEYAVVVGVCGIIVSIAIASLGVPLVRGYNAARQVLISTVP